MNAFSSEVLKDKIQGMSGHAAAQICGIPKATMAKYLSPDYGNHMKADLWIASLIKLGSISVKKGSLTIHSPLIDPATVRDLKC